MMHVVGKPAPSSQRRKELDQYASSHGHRGYCHAELTVFFLMVADAITSMHCAYP